ncbi:MAG: SlyX family protein [Spirochaetales bacterium]|nr:SlyX family protein [Spirochaetales bacterium]
MEAEEKISRPEIEIAHLEEYTRKFNAVVIGQGETVVLLKKQIKELRARIESDREEIDEMKKPPHY